MRFGTDSIGPFDAHHRNLSPITPLLPSAFGPQAWSLLVANLAAEVISDVVYAPFVCLNLRMLTSEHLSRVGAIGASEGSMGVWQHLWESVC